MAIDRVRFLKIENPATGGTDTNPFPVEADPAQDFGDMMGIRVQGMITTPTIQATTAAGTQTLTKSTSQYWVLTGTAVGYSVVLPDATILEIGWRVEVYNRSSQTILIKADGGATLLTLFPDTLVRIVLQVATPAAGTWIFDQSRNTLLNKAGVVAAGSFAGNPKTATVTFVTAMPSATYSISISGVDARSWSYSSRTTAGFVINANANLALTGDVSWEATTTGESS